MILLGNLFCFLKRLVFACCLKPLSTELREAIVNVEIIEIVRALLQC